MSAYIMSYLEYLSINDTTFDVDSLPNQQAVVNSNIYTVVVMGDGCGKSVHPASLIL